MKNFFLIDTISDSKKTNPFWGLRQSSMGGIITLLLSKAYSDYSFLHGWDAMNTT